MPKQKKQINLPKTLEELISDYDRPTLAKALASLEHDISWQVFRAALMKEYLHSVTYALDNVCVTGKQIEAAYQAGVAQTLFDTATSLISKYKDLLENGVRVVEVSRPEE